MQAFIVEHSQTLPKYEAAWKQHLNAETLPRYLMKPRIYHPALSPKDKILAMGILHTHMKINDGNRPPAAYAERARTGSPTQQNAPVLHISSKNSSNTMK